MVASDESLYVTFRLKLNWHWLLLSLLLFIVIVILLSLIIILVFGDWFNVHGLQTYPVRNANWKEQRSKLWKRCNFRSCLPRKVVNVDPSIRLEFYIAIETTNRSFYCSRNYRTIKILRLPCDLTQWNGWKFIRIICKAN